MKSVEEHPTDGQQAGVLRLSEVTLQTIFQSAFFGMVIVGADGTFLRANQAACDLFGYSQAELSALTFRDITYPEDLEAGVALFAQLMEGECSHAKMEKRYVMKDGRVIWTLLSTSAILSPSGEPQYLVTLFQDITERKQSELELAEKELQYRSVFEGATDGILISDLDGGITEVNPAFCAMHGYSRAELVGQSLQLLVRSDDTSVIDAYLDTVRRGGPYNGRSVDLRKDGTSFSVEVHGSPIVYHGAPHVLAVVRDITVQAQNEEVLADLVSSRTRDLATLVDVANVASSSLDLDEVLTRSLDSVLNAMRCDIGAVHLLDESKAGISLTSWKNVPAEVLEEIRTLPTISSLPGRILEQHRPLIVSDMLQDPDAVPASKRLLGRRVYLGVPMRAQERDIGVLVVIGQAGRVFSEAEVSLLSSIAQQIAVAVENARLHKNTEALAVTLERQRLAREIHDTLAQGFTGIKLQLEATESALDIGRADLARERLGRARLLAEQSLAEARRSVWALRSESLLQKALGDALRDSVRGLTAGSGLVVNIGVQDDLPGLAPDLQTDLLRVAQEAVMNVVKHAEATTLTLRLTFEGHRLRLSVEDDGKGFVSAEMGRGRTDRGGFGMIAMEERVSRHGGSLGVRSAPACGTLVTCEVEIGA